MTRVLALDIGTSSVRALVFESGRANDMIITRRKGVGEPGIDRLRAIELRLFLAVGESQVMGECDLHECAEEGGDTGQHAEDQAAGAQNPRLSQSPSRSPHRCPP